MKLISIERLPLGMIKLLLVIDKQSFANRISAIALADATALAAPAKPETKEDRWARAVNECILSEFPPVFETVLQKEKLLPLADPDFDLLNEDLTQDLQVVALLQTMPPLTLGRYTGFAETVVPAKPREIQRELHINKHYGNEARAAANDPEAMATLRAKVDAELIEKGHALAVQLAQQRMLVQLGAFVTGELPQTLLREHYYKEKQLFSFRMQSKKLSLDTYLAQRGLTTEAFRAEMHQISEQKLRASLGLLLIAQKEGLTPTEQAVDEAFAAWLAKKPKDKTFEANDRLKVYRNLCQTNAGEFVVAHSTLLEP